MSLSLLRQNILRFGRCANLRNSESPPYLAVLTITVLLALLPLGNATAENVKIGIPSLTVTMMPLAVAKEQGFFQKEGLNVEMVLMPAALNIKVLLAGDIQYATTITSAWSRTSAASIPVSSCALSIGCYWISSALRRSVRSLT